MKVYVHPTLHLCDMRMDHLPFTVLWFIATCKCMVSYKSKYRICTLMSPKLNLYVFEIKIQLCIHSAGTASVFECLFVSILSACLCIPLLHKRGTFAFKKRVWSCGFVFIMRQRWHMVCQVGLCNCLVE